MKNEKCVNVISLPIGDLAALSVTPICILSKFRLSDFVDGMLIGNDGTIGWKLLWSTAALFLIPGKPISPCGP